MEHNIVFMQVTINERRNYGRVWIRQLYSSAMWNITRLNLFHKTDEKIIMPRTKNTTRKLYI